MRTQVIINPRSANGRTGRAWPVLERRLAAAIGEFTVAHTAAPLDASRLAATAAADGVKRVVAVGGDGTLSEVLHGLLPADALHAPEVVVGYVRVSTDEQALGPEAQKAAEASLCADEQGKFWEMHDAMFAAQRELSIEDLTKRAGEIELDTQKFAECLGSDRYAQQVEQDLLAGQAAGVTGTPALFINGRFLSGAQPYDVFAKVIDDELRRAGE